MNLVGKMIVFNTLNLNFRKIKLTKSNAVLKDCKNDNE